MITADWLIQMDNGLPALSSGFPPVIEDSKRLDLLLKMNWLKRLSDKRQKPQEEMEQEEEWGILITDRDARILWVNDIFTKITGYDYSEAVGRNPRILKSGQHDRWFYENMWRSLLLTGRWKGEIWDLRKDGTLCPQSLSITGIRDDRGEIILYVGIFRELAEPLKCMDHRKKVPSFKNQECSAVGI